MNKYINNAKITVVINNKKQNKGEIIIYKAKDNKISLNVRLEKETVWLAQPQIANLFNVNVPAISKHIKNIFGQGELKKESTISKMETVRKEGKRTIKRKELFN